MRLEEEKMTNSQILQYIIEELGKTTLSWGGDKELFELICAPLPYGNETFQKRRELKQTILTLYQNENFDSKKFHTLADNIICGDNEGSYRQELDDFLREQVEELEIHIQTDMRMLLNQIPCKCEGEKNYKNNFNNWKNGKTDRINRQEVKQRLEKNFYFAPSLWEMHETTVKQAIAEGVIQFVNNRTKVAEEVTTLFDEIRNEFKIKEQISEKELETLDVIKGMSEKSMMAFIATHYPLAKSHSQDFIQKLIPILFEKGYYELLLHDVLESLDVHLQERKQIKKIKAHIYGSPRIAEYLKAFNILSTIESGDDIEIVELRTEAISNIRRHHLSDVTVQIEEKKKSVETLLAYYEDVFKLNDTFHYYPAINLIYMFVVNAILSEDEKKFHALTHTMNDIYHRCKPSIMRDENSSDTTKRYYANITKLEFSLLKGLGSPVAEIARFLELDGEEIPLVSLTRTQRQMQFFIDTVRVIQGLDHPILHRVQSTIEVIDDFMESKKFN